MRIDVRGREAEAKAGSGGLSAAPEVLGYPQVPADFGLKRGMAISTPYNSGCRSGPRPPSSRL